MVGTPFFDILSFLKISQNIRHESWLTIVRCARLIINCTDCIAIQTFRTLHDNSGEFYDQEDPSLHAYIVVNKDRPTNVNWTVEGYVQIEMKMVDIEDGREWKKIVKKVCPIYWNNIEDESELVPIYSSLVIRYYSIDFSTLRLLEQSQLLVVFFQLKINPTLELSVSFLTR